jgi:hypothetical protein
MRLALLGLLASAFVLTACGGSTSATSAHDAGGDGGGAGSVTDTGGEPIGHTTSGLQYEGSVATEPTASGARIELSAPLFPDSTVFQRFQNPAAYPAIDAAEKLRLVDENVKTFDELLTLCAPTHPTIKLLAAGDPPLSVAELHVNYDEVARCAYAQFGAKPYWVPQHVADVDICARKLGPTWHLPTEADVVGLLDAESQLFADTLTVPAGPDWFPVEWYYRLAIYARGADGALVLADLAPGAKRIAPLGISGAALSELYLGNGSVIGLRCMRVAQVQ